ncbi:hypothetical protein [Kribbella sp. NPDC000426]|uniref:hypothetical protein n=1 Tax=Kribbella sp. NPDC000426 TaxID=3154255 RepID=UPI0033223F48
MTREVVVVVETELSERDAAEISALGPAPGAPVNYHLLLADDRSTADRGVAALGVLSRDTFGSPAVARLTGAEPVSTDEPTVDLGQRIEHSARRLRLLGTGEVTVAITHGDLLSGARILVKSTGSREAVVVVSSDEYSGFVLPDRKQRLRDYLGVRLLHAVDHHA